MRYTRQKNSEKCKMRNAYKIINEIMETLSGLWEALHRGGNDECNIVFP